MIVFCKKHQRYHDKVSGCIDCREKRSGLNIIKRNIAQLAKKIEKEMTKEKPSKPPRKSNEDYDEYCVCLDSLKE